MHDLGAHCGALISGGSTSPGGGGGATPASEASSAAAIHRRTPEAVLLFSALSGVLLALREVPRQTARDLRDAVHRLLIQSAGPAAYAAAGVLGQLAAVDGESVSALMMEYMSLATLQAASFGSNSGGRHGAALPLLSSGDGARFLPAHSRFSAVLFLLGALLLDAL